MSRSLNFKWPYQGLFLSKMGTPIYNRNQENPNFPNLRLVFAQVFTGSCCKSICVFQGIGNGMSKFLHWWPKSITSFHHQISEIFWCLWEVKWCGFDFQLEGEVRKMFLIFLGRISKGTHVNCKLNLGIVFSIFILSSSLRKGFWLVFYFLVLGALLRLWKPHT